MAKASDFVYINELGIANQYTGSFSPIVFYEYICPPLTCEHCGKVSRGRSKRVFEKAHNHWPDQEDLWKQAFSCREYEEIYASDTEKLSQAFTYRACPGSEWGKAFFLIRESDRSLPILCPNSQMNSRLIVSRKMRDKLLDWGIKGVNFHSVSTIIIGEKDIDEDAFLREFWMNKYVYSNDSKLLQDAFFELELETRIHCLISANSECQHCGLYSNDYSEMDLSADVLNWSGEDIVRCSGINKDILSKRLAEFLQEHVEHCDFVNLYEKLDQLSG